MHPNHVTLDGNNVVLTLDYLDDPWNNWPDEDLTVLWSAGISSDNFNYSYGYLEMRAILPGYNDNGNPTGEGLWPAFWTYYTETSGSDDNPCWIVLDEIDILEPSGSQYADARTNVFGWHDELGNCT
jgi:beta-glucanase (GH16 family)